MENHSFSHVPHNDADRQKIFMMYSRSDDLLDALDNDSEELSKSVPLEPSTLSSTSIPHVDRHRPESLGDPIQSFYRLSAALPRNTVTSPFWTDKPQLRKGFLSQHKSVLIQGIPIPVKCFLLKTLRDQGVVSTLQRNGYHVIDNGDVDSEEPTTPHVLTSESEQLGFQLERAYDSVYEAAKRGAFVLTLGGSRAVITASISGVLRARRDCCVIFVGAFAGCKTSATIDPTVPFLVSTYSQTATAHLMGWFGQTRLKGFEWFRHTVPEHRVAFVGLRDVAPEEANYLRDSGVRIYSMYEVDYNGIGAVMESAMHAINPHNDRPIHLCFDLSACDPELIPIEGAKEGGLTYRESHFLCEMLARTNLLGSMDVILTGTSSTNLVSQERIGKVARDLISSAVGKRIL